MRETRRHALLLHALCLALAACALLAPSIFVLSTRAKRPDAARTVSTKPRAADVTRYRIDAARSQFTVRAFVGGLLSTFGHNHTIAVRSFAGEARLEDAGVQLSVRASSLAVVDKVSDKERREIEAKMRDEVLEISKYPEITFRSTRVEAQQTGEGQFRARIEGDLTLHGVTRRQIINAQVSVNGNTLRARGEFSLRQTDFKINPPSVGMGTIKVKDTLKLSFDITANRI